MWPLRANGLIVLVFSNESDRIGNNKVSKRKLKKYLFGKETKEKPANWKTITNSPLTFELSNFRTFELSGGLNVIPS